MCTLLIATGVFDGPGLFVISNRDEALDRGAMPPALHRRRQLGVLAPIDSRAGGTWIGLNAVGVFAAITNRFGGIDQAHHQSRGRLVFDALKEESAAAAAQQLRAISPRRHNGFHLVIADATEAYLVCNSGRRLAVRRLHRGYHVISERSFGAAPSARLRRLERRLKQLGDEWSEDHRHRWEEWMREHDNADPLEGACVHLDGANYGTRSSTIIELKETWRFAHAPGPPCTTAYREYSEELRRLKMTAPATPAENGK